MKKLFPLLLVGVLLAACEPDDEVGPNADWQRVSIPTSIDLHDVFFVNESTGFVAGKALDSIFVSVLVDGGDPLTYFRWIAQPHIITDSTRYHQTTITRTVPENPRPAFFKTTDGGNNWSAISTPFVSSILDISFVTPDYGFVATASEGVYKTTDSGRSWNKVLASIVFLGDQNTLQNPFTDVHLVDEDRGFAYNDRHNVIVRTKDGGESWEFVTDFGPVSTCCGGGLAFLSFPERGQIGYAHEKSGYLYQTKDGGETWNEVPNIYIIKGYTSGSSYTVPNVAFLSDNLGYAMASSSMGTLISTDDGGTTWQENYNEPFRYTYGFDIDRIFSVQKDVVYLLSKDENRVVLTKDGGLTYREMSGLEYRKPLNDWFFLGNTGYAVGPSGCLLKYEGKAND